VRFTAAPFGLDPTVASPGPFNSIDGEPGIHIEFETAIRVHMLPTRDLLNIAEELKELEAGLRSLHEPWTDTTSPAGRMVLTVFAGIAEFERELILERTNSGRLSAKARGVRFGRPPKLTNDQIALTRHLVGEGTSVPEASRILKVHRTTLYRALGT
jgi:DNA invertase Pin-like site-specific DNA recombinase